jgi:hypothetical protein
MLLNYHIGRFVLGLLYVGGWVRFGWSSIRAEVASSWFFILQLPKSFTLS